MRDLLAVSTNFTDNPRKTTTQLAYFHILKIWDDECDSSSSIIE